MERLTRKEIKEKRARLQGRIRLSKTELATLFKCGLCGAFEAKPSKNDLCERCYYGKARHA